jgi:two-component system chemotaxis response regulator CheY
MRLLVVDDDAITRMAVVRCFSHDPGVEVVTCAGGEQALQQLAACAKPDWLLVDWNMPGMTGHELVCAVRANPSFEGIRIMMLTLESSMSHVQKALAAGADEYLMKPFTKEMLLEKLALLGRI